MSNIIEWVSFFREVLLETLALLRENAFVLLRSVGWLVVLIFAIDLFWSLIPLDGDNSVESTTKTNMLPDLFAMLLYLLLYVLIAVRTHRVLIKNHGAFSDDASKTLTDLQSHVRFAIRSVWLFIVFGLCFLPLVLTWFPFDSIGNGGKLIYYIFAVLGMGVSLFLLSYSSRLFLSLPSLALRVPMSFAEAHYRTRNHRVLMFFVIVIVPLFTTTILFWLIDALFENGLLISFLSALIEGLFIIFEIALLSVAYMRVNEIREA